MRSSVALLAATPSLHRRERATPLAGEVPSAANPPSGCVFRTRCPAARPRCAEAMPSLEATPEQADHQVACWRAAEGEISPDDFERTRIALDS